MCNINNCWINCCIINMINHRNNIHIDNLNKCFKHNSDNLIQKLSNFTGRWRHWILNPIRKIYKRLHCITSISQITNYIFSNFLNSKNIRFNKINIKINYKMYKRNYKSNSLIGIILKHLNCNLNSITNNLKNCCI